MKWEVSVRQELFRIQTEPLGGLTTDTLQRVTLRVDGEEEVEEVRILSTSEDQLTLSIGHRITTFSFHRNGDVLEIDHAFQTYFAEVATPQQRLARRLAGEETDGPVQLKARMPGRVIRVLHQVGDTIEAGTGLVVIEAMKMQNEMKAPKSGTLLQCRVQEGQTVNTGDLLFEIH